MAPPLPDLPPRCCFFPCLAAPLVAGAGLFYTPLQALDRGEQELAFYTAFSAHPDVPPRIRDTFFPRSSFTMSTSLSKLALEQSSIELQLRLIDHPALPCTTIIH